MGLGCTVGLCLATGTCFDTTAAAQDREPPRFGVVLGTLNKPGYLAFEERLLRRLRVAEGFAVTVFAAPGGNARMLAAGTAGQVYLTRQAQGDVVLLRDTDGDGRADDTRVVASGLELVHGIAIGAGIAYLASPTTVWTAMINADGSFGPPAVLVADLPDGGQHRARTIKIGPDGLLYLGVGSTCNACDETNEENATILRMAPDGSQRTIFASGLRHTIGFGWHPDTGELWGMDNGTDWRGNDTPPEELNRIVEGGNYGWPFCYGARRVDRLLNVAPPGGQSRDAYCAATRAPALTYTAHSAPIGMTFYTGTQFPPNYRGDAFVALRGSWNRTPISGYKVVRIHFSSDGRPTRVEDFVTGFAVESRRDADDGRGFDLPYQFARLTGITVAPDGALLVADDSNGVIYRIASTRNR
jgi:glucose/arabinose dehydrogenase